MIHFPERLVWLDRDKGDFMHWEETSELPCPLITPMEPLPQAHGPTFSSRCGVTSRTGFGASGAVFGTRTRDIA
jgi:hypothetical protein